MGRLLNLTAADGFILGAYRADPVETPRAGIVVLQEIFGVNAHIRRVTDRLAEEGYIAVAPALFDRSQRDFESGYSEPEVQRARQFMRELDLNALRMDATAAATHLRSVISRVGVIGFCLGGSVAHLMALEPPTVDAAVCYYGGLIARHVNRAPAVPVMMHFGAQDHTIPMKDVEQVRQACPPAELHVYESGHGFNCDERGSFHAPSAELAWKRSLDFLERCGL